MTIRCQTLGPVEVTRDGGPPPPELLWRKHLALLVILARAPRRTRTREQLIGLLWADKAEAAARHSLNEGLRVIRRAGGDDAVETRGEQVTLSAAAVELDTDRFEQLVTHGDHAAAAALVVGEFLEGFAVPGASAFEDWVSAERGLWSGRTVPVLCARSGELSGLGRLDEALDVGERALRVDPLSETAIEAVIRALALRGERTAGLSRFEEFARRLEERLRVTPSARLQSLVDRVRRERSGASRPVPATAQAAERRRAPLTGRDAELRTLLTAWKDVCDRRNPGMATLLGAPGTGKSRLAAEVAARARLDGGLVAAVRAVPADLGVPWAGALALAGSGFESAQGVAAASPSAVAHLAARVNAWGERFPTAAAGAGPDAVTTPGALLEVIRAVAESQPVLLVVDDARYLDAETFGFLESLPRDAAGLPVMGLFLAGEEGREELDRIRARIGREVPGAGLVLEPLGPEDIRALVAWALPHYTPAEQERLSRRLALDSAGLPLLAVELLDAVAAGLELAGHAGAWPEQFRTLTATLPGDLPDSIRAAVRVSFRRVSPNGQRVLGAVAVLGDRVQPGDVALATGLPMPDVLAALDELEWTRWLEAEPRGYGFVARVIREIVATDMLTHGQRRRLLEAVGR